MKGNIDEPDASASFISFQIWVAVVKECKNCGDECWYSLPVSSCSSFEINTKRLLVCGIIVVLVDHDFGNETTCTIVLQQITKISGRLNSLLVQHHFVDCGLQAWDDVADGTREVENDGLDGLESIKLTSLQVSEVLNDSFL
jgi:hypothetical protein